MLISFKVKNFLSIKDEVELSLDSTSSKSNPKNLFKAGGYTLLNSCVIYGPNASGKSNIIKAIFFVWNLVKNSLNFNEDVRLSDPPFNLRQFKLDKKMSQMPSEFEIYFIKNDIEYIYGFSCNETKIIKEFLKYKPKGENFKEIFARDEQFNEEFKFTHDKNKQRKIEEFTNKNTLYLSKSTQFNYEKIKPAYDFIANDLVINYSPSWSDYTMKKIHEDVKFKDKVVDILERADFGGIVDLNVKKKKGKVSGFEVKFEGKSPSLKEIDEEGDFYDLKISHPTKDGKVEYFEINEESIGTQKVFNMLGPIFNIFETGKVLIIDELESSLHPNITRFLVKLFSSKYNKKNGQIIFTTHDTTLLKEEELFRRDQVYICSKRPNEQTELYSLVDFKLREDMNFEKAYFGGRVGGLPFIDETFFDENDEEK